MDEEIRYLSKGKIRELAQVVAGDLEDMVVFFKAVAGHVTVTPADLQLSPAETEHLRAIEGLPSELVDAKDSEIRIKTLKNKSFGGTSGFMHASNGTIPY